MHNLRELLTHVAEVSGESVYLEYFKTKELEPVTFGQFNAEVNQWASALIKSGVKANDRVVFICHKCPEQVYLFFAIWQLGAIAVPVSENIGLEETRFIIVDADPTLVITDNAHEDKLKSLCLESPVFTFDHLDKSSFAEKNSPAELDDLAMLVYTSGSTGKPKGVMLSHRNLLTNALSTKDFLPVNSKDRLLSLLPYWHSFALIAEVVLPLFTRNRTVFLNTSKDFSRRLHLYKPTVLLVVPRMLAAFRHLMEKNIATAGAQESFSALLANADTVFNKCPNHSTDLGLRVERDRFENTLLSKVNEFFGGSMRFFIGGGAPLAIDQQHFYQALGLPVYQGYGLTESSPVVSCNIPGNYRFGSSGVLLSWLKEENNGDFTFLNAKGERGKDLVGELLLKGDCVMQGYWNHSDSSAKSLVDGWLHTGDIAYLKDGYLYICGRCTTMIVLRGGEKVHPEHIEDLTRRSEFIDEIMVCGDDCKNLYALINLKEDYLEIDRQLLREDIQKIQKDLAPYQKTKNFLILPKFSLDDGTLTPTFKIRRQAILELYQNEINSFLTANNETVNVCS